MMKLLISGYGDAGCDHLVLCDEYGKISWASTIESPSFVTVCGKRMFAVTENGKEALIHSFVETEGGYRLVDTAHFEGTDLCHVAYSEKHHMVFGACWGTGHLLYATINDEGRFIKMTSLLQVNETGDDTLQTRVHFVQLNAAEDTLIANNVGLDIIYFYEIADGELREKDRIYTERGQHPRHSVYNRDESRLYVITELSNEVLVYAMPEKKLIQRISTLPEGFVGKSHCSAICLSPDEKTVYGANRYSESLVFFGVREDGELYEKLRLPCDGEKPRHFILSKDGKTLIVCYQVSQEICVMPLDDSGLPIPGASHKFPFSAAACAVDLG